MGRISKRRILRSRSMQSMPEITLTPLIDTALTLLVIFMVTTPMMHNAIKVQLPSGKTQEGKGLVNDVVVYLDKNEHIYINGQPVASENLITTLQNSIKQSKQQSTVFVKADKVVPYGTVIGMVDQIKTVGGIQYVAPATRKG